MKLSLLIFQTRTSIFSDFLYFGCFSLGDDLPDLDNQKSAWYLLIFSGRGLEQDITMPAMGNQNPLIGGLNGLCCNCTSCPFLYAMEVTSVTSSKSLIKTFHLDSFCHTANDISASFQLTLKLSKITFQCFCCSAMSLGKCIALTFVTCDALTTRLWGSSKAIVQI